MLRHSYARVVPVMSVRRVNSSESRPATVVATAAIKPLRLVASGGAVEEPSSVAASDALSPAELEAFIAGTSDLVLVLDGNGTHRRILASSADMLVCPPEQMLGKQLQDIMPVETASRLLATVREALRTGERQQLQYSLTVRDQEMWFDATAMPTREETVLWVGRDITQRHAAEQELRKREREVLGIFESAFDGMLVCAPDLRSLQVNAQLCELLGRTREELLSLRYSDLVDEEDLRLRPLRFTELYASGRVVTERRLRRGDGSVLEAEVGTTMLDDGRILLVMRDITARKQAEETIRSLALTDELTGLYNRRGFLAQAEREWQRAMRQQRGALLFTFDLDDLKPINDRYGHSSGDAALVLAAEVLRATFRGSDVVGRMGGDEFAAFVVPGGVNAPDGDAASRLMETAPLIRARMEQHLTVANAEAAAAGHPFRVEMSVGVARLPVGAESPAPSLAVLLAEADAQLYHEKRSRKRARA
jgi:diguanylate cyclase (GGDEF)-like protein/PAS domain S-box-containing protein